MKRLIVAAALISVTAHAELQNVQAGQDLSIRNNGFPLPADWKSLPYFGQVLAPDSQAGTERPAVGSKLFIRTNYYARPTNWQPRVYVGGQAFAELQNVQAGSAMLIRAGNLEVPSDQADTFPSPMVFAADDGHGVHTSIPSIAHLFIPLFNGENLDGWWVRKGDEADFEVEDGKLIVTGDGVHDWIFTDKEYEDFVLRYEYRCVSGEGNSGVAIRAAKKDNPAFSGMEIQVIRPDWPVPWQRSCALYAAAPPAVQADNPFGEWNQVVVSCSSNNVQTFLNGQELYNVRIDQITPESTKDSDWQKPTSNRVPRGHIAIQNHGDKVEFRNIAIIDWGAVREKQPSE